MLDLIVPVSALSSAMAAGALLVGLLVILPLLLREPVTRYPATNTFVLARMDKLMPVCTGIAILSGILLAAMLDATAARILYAAGAVLLAGVFAVSVLALGRINSTVAAIDPDQPRPDWVQLRSRWRRWHLFRVGLGQAGALAYAVALGVSL